MESTRRQQIFRATILTVVTAFLIAMSSQPASANQSGDDVNAANALQNLCGMMGGTGYMYVDRTVGSGKTSVLVYCVGGGLSGLNCKYTPSGKDCWNKSWGSRVTGDLPQLETTDGIEAVASTADAGSAAETETVAIDGVAEPAVSEVPLKDEEAAPSDESPVVDDPAVPESGAEEATNPVADPLPDAVADPATVDQTIDQASSDVVTIEDHTADPVSDPSVADTEIVHEPVDETLEWEQVEDDGV